MSKWFAKKNDSNDTSVIVDSQLKRCIDIAAEGKTELDGIIDVTEMLANTMNDVDISIMFLNAMGNLELISTTIMNDDNVEYMRQNFMDAVKDYELTYIGMKDENFSAQMKLRNGAVRNEIKLLHLGTELLGFCIIEYFKEQNLGDALDTLYSLLILILRNYSLNRRCKSELYMDFQTRLFRRESLMVYLKEYHKHKGNEQFTVGVLHIRNIYAMYKDLAFVDILKTIKKSFVSRNFKLYRPDNSDFAFTIEHGYIDASVILKEISSELHQKYPQIKICMAYADGSKDCVEAYELCERSAFKIADWNVSFLRDEPSQQIGIPLEELASEPAVRSENTAKTSSIKKVDVAELSTEGKTKRKKKNSRASKQKISGQQELLEDVLLDEDFSIDDSFLREDE